MGRGSTYLILLLGAGIMVLPFLWMLSTSVMTIGEANGGRLLPRVARMTCPYVNLPKLVEGTVIDFAVSPEVREGEQELHTDSYYVEVAPGSESSWQWQFRLVNNKAEPVADRACGTARRCPDGWTGSRSPMAAGRWTPAGACPSPLLRLAAYTER